MEPTENTTIAEWQTAAHGLSVQKGWWSIPTPEEAAAERKLALIALKHCRLSDELEAIRKGETYRADNDDLELVVHRLSPAARSMLAKVALMHSELTEAVEAVLENEINGGALEMYRAVGSNKPEGFVVELADVVIRIFDTCGRWGFNLARAIRTKHEYNATRPTRHGGKLA